MSSFDKDLRHLNLVVCHSLREFDLVLPGHKDVPLFYLDEEGPHDLSDGDTPRVGVPQNTEGGDVHHHFSLLSLGVILKKENNNSAFWKTKRIISPN